MRTKIAIACQGGGSQTAFTAGVLKALCDSRLRDGFEVVGVSGTSGGALCATLVLYSFRRGDQPVWQRLIDFWHDNTAQNHWERMINDAIIGWMRMVNRGMLPMFQTSPASPLVQAISQFVTAGQRREFGDFKALLRRHIDFDELAAWGPQPTAPVRIPKAFAAEPDKAYHIPWIEMSEEVQGSLDYEGKLDRSPTNVESLITHGEERGRAFLAERARRVAAAGAGPAGEAAGPVRHR